MATSIVFAGKALPTPAIAFLVRKAFDYLDKYRKSQGMEELKSRLQLAMPKIQAVFDVVNPEQFREPSVALDGWLWQLRDAVEDVENAVDELEYYELEEKAEQLKVSDWGSSRAKMKHKVVRSVRNVSILDKTVKSFAYRDTFKRLRKALESFDRSAAYLRYFLAIADYHKRSASTSQQLVSYDHETSSELSASKFAGREREKDKIIGWITNTSVQSAETVSSTGRVSIISVVGRGGIGKTTLAQNICNEDAVRNHFEVIWVTVSASFSATSVTSKILESVTRGKPSSHHLEPLQKLLKEKLQSMKFLLVLDDVWEDNKEGEWNKLLAPLRNMNTGSKILLTTRMRSVVDMATSVMGVEGGQCLTLQELEEDEYNELFNHHVYTGLDLQDYENFKYIGEQIARRLRGCPLVIKVVAGNLRDNMNIQYWNRFLHEGLEDFNGNGEGIMRVLRLCYYSLPTELQICFRYCCIFPQDYKFEKKELIQMWMGSGLISQDVSGSRTFEDIGEQVLVQLNKKSFFDLRSRGNTFEGPREEYYVMHDLMHDLARNVSSGECARITHPAMFGDDNHTVRHMCIANIHSFSVGEVKKICNFKYLRTIIFDDSDEAIEKDVVCALERVVESLEFLRLFSSRLSDRYQNLHLTEKCGKLKHLRYIRLQQISPEGICGVVRLYHLKLFYCDGVWQNGKKQVSQARYLGNLDHLRYIYGFQETSRGQLEPMGFSVDDVPIRERGQVRETGAPVSALLGAMRPLLGKLDMLLLAPPQGCSKKVKEGMCLLKDDVEEISSYLDELSEVEDPPPMAKSWMNEARDLSYDMEDYIDSLYVSPAGPSLVVSDIKTTRSHNKLTSLVKTPKRLKRQEKIEATLSEFRVYVQEAIQRREVYVLSDSNMKSTLRHRFVSIGPMLPTLYEETADIVINGRMNEFMNSLANDADQQLKVLSVLGSACLGKTTLARVLYNKFAGQYDCRAFIRVSRKPDMKRIFRDMLSQVQRQHSPQDCKEIDLIDGIRKCLQDKRYLIIIDDVWAASVWDIISHAFPKGSHGSRIITTTQIEDVALTCCCYQSERVFEMKPLDDEHSRKLFFKRLFGSESYCPQQFREVLNEIVELCGGLPLATISIASLLASQPVITVDLLTYIHQSLSSYFLSHSTSDRTRQVLNLSFNNLPHYLKTCLMYLGMYSEGHIFHKDDVVKQWVAEGFIDTTEGQDVEKVAGGYLDQLIGRRFIQPMRIKYNNEVVSFAVHDAVHDLIAHKSSEENFTVAIDYSRKNVSLSHKVRRLSLLFGDARYAQAPTNIRKSQVRSLRFVGLFKCMPCIAEFKLLRVLNLQLSGHRGNDDNPANLTGISELLQLRYLKIACDVCIELPNHGLQVLETLDITDARLACVPWYIHLPRLLHLNLTVDRNLLDWPISLASLGKLNNLQDLHLTSASSSSDILPSEHPDRSMEALGSLLGGHGNLKTIVLAHGSSVKNIVAGGASKTTIYWNGMSPPPLLQRFELWTHSGIIFSRIPMWVGKLGNLCTLKIAVRVLQIYCVDILRGLPALTALSLSVETAPIDKIIFDKAGFSVLKYFKLRFMSGIASVEFEADAMPNLWKLKLVLNDIPQMDQHQHCTTVVCIEHMPGLKEISAKIGGAAANTDAVSVLRTVVSNHPSNPTINVQLVDSFYGEKSTEQKQQQDEILEEEEIRETI